MERKIEETFTYDVAIPFSRRLQRKKKYYEGDTKWVLQI